MNQTEEHGNNSCLLKGQRQYTNYEKGKCVHIFSLSQTYDPATTSLQALINYRACDLENSCQNIRLMILSLSELPHTFFPGV